MLTFTDEQRSALIKARQDWQAAEQARDELDRAKLPVSSRSFDAVSSHGLPRGLDDRLTRVEALRAALERAVGRAGESLCRADEVLETVEMKLSEVKFFRAYYQRASSIEEAAQAAEITEKQALKLKSLVEFSAEEKPKTRKRNPWFGENQEEPIGFERMRHGSWRRTCAGRWSWGTEAWRFRSWTRMKRGSVQLTPLEESKNSKKD